MPSDSKEILRVNIVESVPVERIIELKSLLETDGVQVLNVLGFPASNSKGKVAVYFQAKSDHLRISSIEDACRKVFASDESMPNVEMISQSDYLDVEAKSPHAPNHGKIAITLLTKNLHLKQLLNILDRFKSQNFPGSRALNIQDIPNLFGPIATLPRVLAWNKNNNTLSASEIYIRATTLPLLDIVNLWELLANSDGILNAAISTLPSLDRREHYRLIAFDMDSTLIQQEVIDELGREQGRYDEVAAITASTLRGEIDFRESLYRRVALLEGMPVERLQNIVLRITLTLGAKRLVATLKTLGYRTAIISGGFNFVGTQIQEQLGIDHLHAHTLREKDGKLTGEIVGTVIDGAEKEVLLREICRQEGIGLDRTIAIGDGANDLPMLKAAGMGIAFHAKPVVREAASFTISEHDLDAVLYFLGLESTEIVDEPTD